MFCFCFGLMCAELWVRFLEEITDWELVKERQLEQLRYKQWVLFVILGRCAKELKKFSVILVSERLISFKRQVSVRNFPKTKKISSSILLPDKLILLTISLLGKLVKIFEILAFE